MKIDWMFKKYVAPVRDKPAPAAAAPVAPARAAKAAAPAAAVVDWQPRLQAALGDDAALLALAREDAPLDIKLAAVSALASEAALKQAEREFRSHDRRVHRVAKQRHQAQVAQRETREQAGELIAQAHALESETQIPLNRLVELDRAWQALDGTLLEPSQRDEFTALLTQLGSVTRERAEQALQLKRWLAQARSAQAALQAACAAAADGTQTRSDLEAAATTARAALDAAPAGEASVVPCESLRAALQRAAALAPHLALLDELLHGAPAAQAAAPPPPPPPAPTPAEPADAALPDAVPAETDVETGVEPAADAGAAAAPRDPLARWQQLAPLADTALAEALNRRFEQWQRAREEARQARRTQQREQAKDQQRAARSERSKTLAAALDLAEAALAAGHLTDTNKHLVEIDDWLHGGASAGVLRARIDALQAQYAQLKGWQHWGGGVARDELVLQAEALAAATAGEGAPGGIKLSLKQQAETIDDMRARWKELDRLGGATSRALWQRFDGALKLAYQPVATHVAAQRAAREQNLQSRQALIVALDAVALPDPAEGAAPPPDWKALAVALDQFQAEWRKLGPLEHTVPHKSREALLERMRKAMARLEAPLHEARRSAQAAREQLVARARELGAANGAAALARDMVGRVRELQAEWQQQAKALPLARGAENALWAEFKTAIDALFSARDAVFSARDAEFKAHGAERAALIERLAALTADTPPGELKRTLAEVEAQWQRTGPAPRNDAATLEARFRQARDAARQWLAGSAQRAWHASCDALAAKLALCEAAETGVEGGADAAAAKAALAERWAALATLPTAWEQALSQRAGLSAPVRGSAPVATSSDALLLQLESALQLESPAAWQQARRDLKLQAMKAALEGRPSAAAPLAPDQALAVLLGRAALDTAQRERLATILAARRNHGPGGG